MASKTDIELLYAGAGVTAHEQGVMSEALDLFAAQARKEARERALAALADERTLWADRRAQAISDEYAAECTGAERALARAAQKIERQR